MSRDDVALVDAPWRVQLVAAGGEVLGAGVLVADRQILTCAHVVSAVLGTTEVPALGAKVPVRISGHDLTASLGHWVPIDASGEGDIAVLDLLTTPVDAITPARLRRSARSLGREVRTYGHPAGRAHGAWAEARAIGSGGTDRAEWVQLVGLGREGHRIVHGFSGAGVLDRATGTVIGLVVAADGNETRKVAWMLPMEVIARYWKPLRKMLPRQAPRWPARLGATVAVGTSLAVGLAGAGALWLLRAAWIWVPVAGLGAALACYLFTAATDAALDRRDARRAAVAGPVSR